MKISEIDEFKFDFPPKPDYSATIIGLGGAAGRIVDKLVDKDIPDTKLCAFGMNKQEVSSLVLADKFLIGSDGLGSGKNRDLATLACRHSLPVIEKILSVPFVAIYVACLGGATGESCLKVFLQEAKRSNVKVTMLITTIPHHLEGIEKRDNAKRLIGDLKPFVDGIMVVDYEDLKATSILSLYAEADRIVADMASSFVSLFTVVSMVCFDFNDIMTFLREAKTKIIDFRSVSGNIDTVEYGLKNLPFAKYSLTDDIAAMIFEICAAEPLSIPKSDFERITSFLFLLHDNIKLRLTISPYKDLPNGCYKVNLYLTKTFSQDYAE